MDVLDRVGRSEWRHNWPLVLAAAAGMALATVPVYATGAFIQPLEHEFGWTRTQISSGMVLPALTGFLLSPLVGHLIDRIGARLIGLVGVCLLSAALALLSQASPSIGSWWLIWGGISVVGVLVNPTVWTAAVSRRFKESRGLALAAVLCGPGLAAALTPIVSNSFIEHFGWRAGFIGLSAFWAIPVIPVVFLLFSAPRGADRERAKTSTEPPPAGISGVAAREAFRSLRYAKLTAGVLAISMVGISFAVNLMPILVSEGLPRSSAAALAGTMGLASIIGRLSAGFLLDRLNGNVVAGAMALLPFLSSLLLLVLPGQVSVAAVAVSILGFALGSELDAAIYLTSRHFGLRSFGVLVGVIMGFMGLATGVAPLAVSRIYDLTHAYTLVLFAAMPICLLASLCFLTLGAFPKFDERSDLREAN